MRFSLFNSRRRKLIDDVDEKIRARASNGTVPEVSFRRKLAANRVPIICGTVIVFIFMMSVLYLNVPVPDGFSSPWRLRMHVTKLSLKRTINSWYSSLGWEQGTPSVANRSNEHLLITTGSYNGVSVRIYKPIKDVSATQLLPALVYFHGGGWYHFSADSYDQLLVHVALETKILIVSVDYRLAPKYPFPAPLDDCVAATKYVFEHNTTIGINSSRVAIGGDSSGANLAAAVAMKLRDDHAEIMPTCQILVYPPLQAIDFSLPSYVQNKDNPLLTAQSMASMWSRYATGTEKYATAMSRNKHTTLAAKKAHKENLNHEDIPEKYRFEPYRKPDMPDGDPETWKALQHIVENPYFAPLMSKYYMYLPRTFLYTAHYDILRDDGLLYKKRLKDAAVDVTHVHGPTGFHGIFKASHDFAEADSCLKEVVSFIKENV